MDSATDEARTRGVPLVSEGMIGEEDADESVVDGISVCRTGSGLSKSLLSILPFSSEAKNSSPRPRTTEREGRCRVPPSGGKSHSCRSGGRL